MKPTIFLSHSCKDRELTPPPGLDQAQTRDRAQRLEFARRVRRRLFDNLTATGRFEVWLDTRGGLRAGDVWRDGIHRVLRDCRGAVLLLTPEALESGWVLKEATILTWRALLGEPVVVVPLLLQVVPEDLEAMGFAASGVAAIQTEFVPSATAAACDAAVERVTQLLSDAVPAGPEPQRPSRWATTVEQWVTEVARLLTEGDERYVREMFRILGLDYDDRERLPEPHVAVATELLDSDPDTLLDVLHVLKDVRTDDQKTLLRRAVRPLWVQARAAHRLPLVADSATSPRVAVIDAVQPQTGADYVARAYCGKLRSDRVFAPDDHTDGTVEQALARIEMLLLDYLPVEDPQGLAEDVRRNGPVYVVLGAGASREELVAELVRRYPALTFVAMVGGQPQRLGALATRAEVLAPPLAGRETAGARFRNRLEMWR